MRTVIEQKNSTRFRISAEKLPVEEDQLIPVVKLSDHVRKLENHMVVENLTHDDETETFKYIIEYDRFSI